MKTNTAGFSPDKWNMAQAYWEEFDRLNIRYYEASLSPGFGDDIETFKRLVDHSYCNFRIPKNKEKRLVYWCKWKEDKKNVDKKFIDFVDEQISLAERMLGGIVRKQSNMSNLSPTSSDVRDQSEAKRIIRLAHREVMMIHKLNGAFDIERPHHTYKDMKVGQESVEDDYDD